MRSKATLAKHPLHPMLIAFPLAFTVGAFVLDLVGRLAGWGGACTAGAYLSAGAVVTGLVAGVPGFIDYLYVVPPNSSAKQRATYHMIVSVSALVLFGVSWAFRDTHSLEPGVATIILEGAGVALVTVGGWLGGTLVYRNQIGVDHRYANAGRWKEEEVRGAPGQSVAVARVDELEDGQMKLLHVGGRRIVLARTEKGHVAFDDRCTHRGGSLAGGVLACGVVTCPWHGSQFDVRNGKVEAGPAEEKIGTYQVSEADGEVRLTVPPPEKD